MRTAEIIVEFDPGESMELYRVFLGLHSTEPLATFTDVDDAKNYIEEMIRDESRAADYHWQIKDRNNNIVHEYDPMEAYERFRSSKKIRFLPPDKASDTVIENSIRREDFSIHNTPKLDVILSRCCQMVLDKNANDSEYWGMVGACVLDPQNRTVYGVNHVVDSEGNRDHAEVVAIKNYIQRYGAVPQGSMVITTLSPCSSETDQPVGRNCTDYIEQHGVHKVYCGYEDPTQTDTPVYKHKQFHTMQTRNPKLRELCRAISDTFLET